MELESSLVANLVQVQAPKAARKKSLYVFEHVPVKAQDEESPGVHCHSRISCNTALLALIPNSPEPYISYAPNPEPSFIP